MHFIDQESNSRSPGVNDNIDMNFEMTKNLGQMSE